MTKTLTLDGKEYPISDEFAHAMRFMGKLSFTHDALEAERTGLMRASNYRRLTRMQRERLDNITHLFNVSNTIRVVGDHHDPMTEWGLDGWDAVHGNQRGVHCGCAVHEHECAGNPTEECKEPYGCQLRHVFDNHAATDHFGHNRLCYEHVTQSDGSVETVQLYEPVVHPIEPWGSCNRHLHLMDDHKAHYAQVVREAEVVEKD